MRHRHLPAVTEALRATHVRSWLRSQPGHLGPDPDRLVQRGVTPRPVLEEHRLAGPSDHPVLCPVDEDYWRDDVEDLGEKVAEGWEPPPMVVTYRDDQLVLEDGNHRAEGMRRAGERFAWCVVSFESTAERDHFLARAERLEDDPGEPAAV